MKPGAPRRCLLATDAEPAQSGAPDWRRFRALVEHYRLSNFEVDGLIVCEGLLGAEAISHCRASIGPPILTTFAGAGAAIQRMVRRGDHDVVHVGSPLLGHALGSTPAGTMRIVDMLETPAAVAARAGHSLADDEEAALFAHADLVVAADPAGIEYGEARGRDVVAAPFVRQADRLRRPSVRGGRFLAGLWVERAAIAIDAVNAFFEAVRARGGGGAPNFAIAGPGAGAIRIPALPHPVTVMPQDIDERVFYRGLDILIAPDLMGGAPRFDILSALEMGATPLASTAALDGLRRAWRLPHFGSVPDMAEYVFEKGQQMREGGLLTELRARADWTWTSISNAAAQDRALLNQRIRKKLTEIRKESIA